MDACLWVAICMATFNPVAELFERQVDSIRSQTHSHLVCLVNDDASDAATFAMIEKVCGRDDRFVVSRNPERLGFYLNFERVFPGFHRRPSMSASPIRMISGMQTSSRSSSKSRRRRARCSPTAT